jgi:hypothetical protein
MMMILLYHGGGSCCCFLVVDDAAAVEQGHQWRIIKYHRPLLLLGGAPWKNRRT